VDETETFAEPVTSAPVPGTTASSRDATVAPATATEPFRGTAAPAVTITPRATAPPATGAGDSTPLIIAGVIILALIGAGAYLYMKKRSP
jgi:LPXTG-motif cell wall-anchored protein